MPTPPQLQKAFQDFDKLYFAGQLASGTTVQLDPSIDDEAAERGTCKKDGSQIKISSVDPDWECTLLHEMVHAFEHRYPGSILVTTEGQSAHSQLKAFPFLLVAYVEHSAEFFTKLFEVMRSRGHNPSTPRDFARYFG